MKSNSSGVGFAVCCYDVGLQIERNQQKAIRFNAITVVVEVVFHKNHQERTQESQQGYIQIVLPLQGLIVSINSLRFSKWVCNLLKIHKDNHHDGTKFKYNVGLISWNLAKNV